LDGKKERTQCGETASTRIREKKEGSVKDAERMMRNSDGGVEGRANHLEELKFSSKPRLGKKKRERASRKKEWKSRDNGWVI
jgi:hypothetical protein